MWHELDISLPGLEIYPGRRKIYRDRQEIHLTTKEYKLLCLLVANKGKVLTYTQIYEKIWGDISSGGESTAIGYHICNLREKLYAASLANIHEKPENASYADSLLKNVTAGLTAVNETKERFTGSNNKQSDALDEKLSELLKSLEQ